LWCTWCSEICIIHSAPFQTEIPCRDARSLSLQPRAKEVPEACCPRRTRRPSRALPQQIWPEHARILCPHHLERAGVRGVEGVRSTCSPGSVYGVGQNHHPRCSYCSESNLWFAASGLGCSSWSSFRLFLAPLVPQQLATTGRTQNPTSIDGTTPYGRSISQSLFVVPSLESSVALFQSESSTAKSVTKHVQ
jgi:hypothetical protein